MRFVETFEDPGKYMAGMSFYGNPFASSGEWTEENEIGRLWQRFYNRLPDVQHLASASASAMYEAHIEGVEFTTKGFYEVFTGFPVNDPSIVPFDLVVKRFPASVYGRFEMNGREAFEDWPIWFSDEWLPTSGYIHSPAFSFVVYDKRFLGMDRLEESVLEVHIPLEARA